MAIVIPAPSGPTTPPEPEKPTLIDAYLAFYPITTEYVRLLLRNSAKRAGEDVKGWPT